MQQSETIDLDGKRVSDLLSKEVVCNLNYLTEGRMDRGSRMDRVVQVDRKASVL